MKIIEDLKAVSQGELKKSIVTLLTNPCFHSICLFRMSSFFYKIHFVPISKIIWYLNRVIFSVDIDYRADLAGGFVLIHGLGTVIGKDVKSMGHLTVYQNVTLGGNQGHKKNIKGKETGQPYIEDNVKIYTGATVVGPVHISSNSIIKARQIITENNINEIISKN